MKSITPDRCQQELQEEVERTLALPLARRPGSASPCSSKKGASQCLAADPYKMLTFEEIGLPKIVSALCRRPVACSWLPDLRGAQDHNARDDDQLHQ